MGAIYRFKCRKCGYEIECQGGKDLGLRKVFVTRICSRCRNLVDVFEGYCSNPELLSDSECKCEYCGNTEFVDWDPVKMPCPKCGNKLERGELTGLWD